MSSKDESALTRALEEFEDDEDARAAAMAASEEVAIEGADEDDFEWEGGALMTPVEDTQPAMELDDEVPTVGAVETSGGRDNGEDVEDAEEEEEEEEGGTTVEYMLSFIRSDMEFFSEWRI